MFPDAATWSLYILLLYKKKLLTPTWFEHATFWSGVRRATVAPRSPHIFVGVLRLLNPKTSVIINNALGPALGFKLLRLRCANCRFFGQRLSSWLQLCFEPIWNFKLPTAVVAEWLRRWTWNPLGYARTGSNPVDSVAFWMLNSWDIMDTASDLRGRIPDTKIPLGQYGDRTHDIRVISTTL